MNYTRETSELDKKAIQIGVLVENHPCNATIEDISFMLNDEGTRSRETIHNCQIKTSLLHFSHVALMFVFT